MKRTLLSLIFIASFVRLFAGSGGPDLFGYTWRDSNDPNGPVFHWIDIVSEDREIHGLGDDNNRGPYNTSFGGYNPFRFYWYDVEKFWIGSNGYISFGSINLASIFPSIPDSLDNKHNFIAGSLADLTFMGTGNPGKCYSRVTTDSIIISYVAVPFYASTSPFYAGSNTFQIILSKTDRSIQVNFLSCSGTTLNTDIKTGMENITGNIGLQPYTTVYPPANFSIKYYYPSNPTYFVRDGASKWNSQYGNGGLFLPYPCSFPLIANIANTGNLKIAPVYTATGRLKNASSVVIGSSSVNFTDTLFNGQDSTFIYPSPFTPVTTGRYSYTTSLSGILNDAFHSNDSVTQELVVIDTALTSYELNYSDNVADYPGISWTDGTGGLGVYLVPPDYPVQIMSTKFYIESNPNGAYFIAKIFDDDGPDGTPGTMLDSVFYSGSIFVGGYNTVTTSNNIVINNGGVYVLWEMYGQGITLARDITLPISLRTYEYISGMWSEYRNSQAEDFLIGMVVNKTTVADVGVPAIVSPVNNSVITVPTTVTCWLKNHGQQSESNFPVHYKVYGSTTVNETYTGTAILPGDSVQYSFSTLIQAGFGYSGDFCVWSDLNNDFNVSNDTSCIMIQTTVGINNASYSGSINIYPNPFDDKAIIEFSNPDHSDYEMMITDVLGKVVTREGSITGNKFIIEKGQLSPGMYILELKGKQRYRSKFIIE